MAQIRLFLREDRQIIRDGESMWKPVLLPGPNLWLSVKPHVKSYGAVPRLHHVLTKDRTHHGQEKIFGNNLKTVDWLRDNVLDLGPNFGQPALYM